MVETAYDGLGHITELITHIHAVDQVEKYVLDGLGNLHLRWASPHRSSPNHHTELTCMLITRKGN